MATKISELTARLTPCDVDIITASIDALQGAGFTPPHGIAPERLIYEYQFSLKRVPHIGLRLAVHKLRRGELNPPRRGFIPLPAELAHMARVEAQETADDLSRIRSMQASIEERSKPKIPDTDRQAQIERVRSLVARFKAGEHIPFPGQQPRPDDLPDFPVEDTAD